MLQGIAHTAITVRNMERSLHFYCDLLGFKVGRSIDLPEGGKIVFIQALHGELELFQFPSSTPRPEEAKGRNVLGLQHIALTVDNLDELFLRLQGEGVVFLGEPREVRPGGPKIVNLTDPDDVLLELVQPATSS